MAAIIFDFDGTIADNFETIVRIFYELTGREDTLPASEVERLRGMTLARAAEELRVPPWKMPWLLLRGRRKMTRRIASLEPQPGLPGVIRKLYDEGHQLFIVSSNSERNIELFLKQHHMHKQFVGIYGGSGLLNKGRLLSKVLRKNSLEAATTWYVGDEVRDIVAAQSVGVHCVAVTWGFNNGNILLEHEPEKLASSASELLTILEQI